MSSQMEKRGEQTQISTTIKEDMHTEQIYAYSFSFKDPLFIHFTIEDLAKIHNIPKQSPEAHTRIPDATAHSGSGYLTSVCLRKGNFVLHVSV